MQATIFRRWTQFRTKWSRLTLVTLAGWGLSAVASAQTTYTGGPGPSDFTLASNWSNGAPLNQNATVNTGAGAISLFFTAPTPDPYSIEGLAVQGTHALTFNQSSGTLTVAAAGTLNFGASNSIYNLSGGTLQVGGTNGIAGSATVNLGGGTLQATGADLTSNTPAVLAANTTSTIDTTTNAATLTAVSGSGSLNKVGANDLNIDGTIVEGSGGTIHSVANLDLGTVNSAGTLDLNTGSNVVITGQSSTGSGHLQVSYGGTGTLNIAGGTLALTPLDANAGLFVGEIDGLGNVGVGTVNMSSGSIVVDDTHATGGAFGDILVGLDTGTGIFNQSGGSVVMHTGALEVGSFSGIGTYTMTNNASITLGGAAGTIYIGDSAGGNGLLHISDNSTLTITTAVFSQTYLGTAGGTGRILQDGAGSVVTVDNTNGGLFYVGEDADSSGTYDLVNGSLGFIGGNVRFGDAAGSVGTLNQTGGTMTVAANVSFVVGYDGSGTYDLSAGTATFHGALVLANDAGSTATLNLTGTGILQVGGTNGIAQGLGTAAVNLGGGTVQVIGSNLTTSVNATLVANTQSTIDTNSLGATFSGILSGSGSLAKAGAGTLVLSGANNYSGGTTINGGTIQAGSTTALGAASGNLNVTNGAFDLHGFDVALNGLTGSTNAMIGNTGGGASHLTVGSANGSGTFAGVIADDAPLGLTKTGTGTEILNGANTYTGGTEIDQGTLTAGNASALGMGNVSLNGGVLNTGNGNRAIHVGGTYAQLAGGTLSLTLDSPTVHDDMTVTGQAALGGTLHLTLNPGFYSFGTSIDLIQTGGLNGTTFNSVMISGPEQGTLEYSATDVSVLFNRLYLARTAGLTANQAAVAGYLDQYATTVTTGNFAALVNAIYPLNAEHAALGAALDQISPQSLQVFRSIAFDNATFDSQELNDHLANLRDGLTGFDESQLSVMDSTLDPTLSQINSRLLAWNPNATPGLISDSVDSIFGGSDMKDMKATRSAEAQGPGSPWSTFIAGNVVLADLSHTDDIEHQDFTTGSVKLGADYRLDPHFTVGALLAFGHTDATLDHQGSKATVDSYSPAVYASYVDGGWYGNGLFSYGYNSYTEDRHISIGALDGTNHGAPQGNQYNGNLTGGYEFQRGGWKFGPVASLQYVNLGIDSFREQGPTALNIQNQSEDSLRTQLGIEARHAIKTGSVILTPHLSASWQHEFLDNGEGITSQFTQVGSGSFTVQTSHPERDSAFIDAGLDAQIVKEVTLFADYETEAGQAHFFAQSIQAGVQVRF